MSVHKVLLLIILTFAFAGVNSPARAAEEPLSQQEVTAAVVSLIGHIQRDYLHDQTRVQAAERLTKALNQGEFNGRYSYGRLKIKLESMLQKATGDAGFELLLGNRLNGTNRTSNERLPGAIQTQRLEGNIGYLAIDGDLVDDNWPEDIAKAMAEFSNSKALIIDLRSAGLSPMSLAERFLGYFIPAGQQLSTVNFAHRHGVPLVSEGAEKPVNPDMPVFIATSPFIAGSWEFVAYTLKHAKAATIVGASTIGLGYMNKTQSLSEHLSIRMAYAELLHPVTNNNWQGRGVIPDVSCDADDAINVTLELLNERLMPALNTQQPSS